MKKSDLSQLIGASIKIHSNPHLFVYEPKMEDLVMEAQKIFPNPFFFFLIKPDPHHYS